MATTLNPVAANKHLDGKHVVPMFYNPLEISANDLHKSIDDVVQSGVLDNYHVYVTPVFAHIVDVYGIM